MGRRIVMANLASSRKRARQAVSRREHNVGLRSRFRTYMKKVVKAVEHGDKQTATDAYKQACVMADNAASKKLIHKNKAARHKSHLNQRIRQMA